jgi:hypothetical protein
MLEIVVEIVFMLRRNRNRVDERMGMKGELEK